MANILISGEFGATGPDELRGWLQQHGTLAETREVALEYGRKAIAALDTLPVSPERDALALAPSFITDRDY
ncbi:MAG: hypothetical protein V1750_09145 [Acidobacteriota bacterium]